MRFHTQTAGVSLTAQQPKNNIARVAIQALAAVLGGTQSLHTDGFDEALALPTEDAARIALRTQQILAYESGVANTVDPLGGSYFVEKLTRDMEDGAFEYFRKLDAMGGMVKAIEHGFPQKEIAEASYTYQRAVEKKEKIIVGVNEYVIDETPQEILYIDESARDQQTAKLKQLRTKRSQEAVDRTLKALASSSGGRTRRQPRPNLLRQYHALHPGLRARLRHCWRDMRSPARRDGHLYGSQHRVGFPFLKTSGFGVAPSAACQGGCESVEASKAIKGSGVCMEYVNLGSTGMKVSRICLGAMTYGSKQWREWVLEEEESLPFFRRALEAGINFFDTADMYSVGAAKRSPARR